MLNPVLSSFNEKVLRSILADGGLSLFSYPTENLLGHWTNRVFTQDSVVAVDYSDNKNDAVLKTGRCVSLDGIDDYALIPYSGIGIHRIDVLYRTNISQTLDAIGESLTGFQANWFITSGQANGQWNLATMYFGITFDYNEITENIRVGSSGNGFGSNYFQGDLAFVKLYDVNGNLIDTCYLNEHSSGSLNGLPIVSQGGSLGQYFGCTALNQQSSPVPQLAALDFNISGNQLIPKHLTDDTDALGNPITNERLTNTTFNVPPGGLVEVSDITAYNALQTAMGWFYYYSTDQIFMGLGTPTISAVSGSLTSSGITTPTYYINGVQSVTLNTGWNFIVVTTTTAFDAGPISWDEGKSDKISIYSDAKSPALILETYNKTYLKYFPSDPTIGEEWQHDGVTWTFDGNSWNF